MICFLLPDLQVKEPLNLETVAFCGRGRDRRSLRVICSLLELVFYSIVLAWYESVENRRWQDLCHVKTNRSGLETQVNITAISTQELSGFKILVVLVGTNII